MKFPSVLKLIKRLVWKLMHRIKVGDISLSQISTDSMIAWIVEQCLVICLEFPFSFRFENHLKKKTAWHMYQILEYSSHIAFVERLQSSPVLFLGWGRGEGACYTLLTLHHKSSSHGGLLRNIHCLLISKLYISDLMNTSKQYGCLFFFIW